MTKNNLLEALAAYTEEAERDFLLPVRRQKEDLAAPGKRPAAVYRMRLPDSSSLTKKAPYILHMAVSGRDAQPVGQLVPEATCVVRSVFCVYDEDEQEGALLLLELMERLRIALLRQVTIGNQFRLDLQAGLETVIYDTLGPPPEGTAPYYLGEMVSTWRMPPTARTSEVHKIWGN